ncbi:MAG: ABC transporter permease [Ignavibacteria bacterium]|nr:ABC transporter permease [Ignavibacteria bacterium]
MRSKYIELRRFLRNRLFLLGLLILVPIALVAIFAPFIAPFDPLDLDVKNKFLPMNSGHLFGTDEFGRDVFSRVVHGSTISLRVGGLTALFTSILGIVIGLASGYYKSMDAVIMRVMDGLMIFPGLLLGIMLMAAMGPHEMNVVLAMTILYTPRIVRVVRSSVLEIKTMEYIDAARVLGVHDLRILLRHILPNCLAPLIVQVTFGFAWAILVESGLSFLGLGTPPPAPSWGNIIGDGREFIRTAPWLMIFPGVMISAAVLGLNLIGDGLRDILDPKLRHVSSKVESSVV